MEWLIRWLPLIGILILFNFLIRTLLHYKFKEMSKGVRHLTISVGFLLIVYVYACNTCFC